MLNHLNSMRLHRRRENPMVTMLNSIASQVILKRWRRSDEES
jgi:hypothetical protein